MKTPAALFASALLLLTASARAGDAPSGLAGSFIAGDVGFTVTNDYVSRGGIVQGGYGDGRDVTFVAVNCKVSSIQIDRDTITCHAAGHWGPPSPGVAGGGIFFSIHKGRAAARWEALCRTFLAWHGTNTLSIRCKAWGMREDNGLLLFNDTAGIGIGPEQREKPVASHTAAIVDEILRQRAPSLAMGGSTGWRTR